MARRVLPPKVSRVCTAFTITDGCNTRPKMKDLQDKKTTKHLSSDVPDTLQAALNSLNVCKDNLVGISIDQTAKENKLRGVPEREAPGDTGRGETVPGRIVNLCREDRERVTNLAEQLARYVEENRALRKEVLDVKMECALVTGRNEVQDRELREAKTSGEAARGKCNALEEKLRDAVKESSKEGERYGNLRKELRDLKAEAAKEKKKVVEISATNLNERTVLESQLFSLKVDNEKLKMLLEKCKQAITSQNETNEANLKEVKKETNILSQEKLTLQWQIGILRSKLNDVSKDAVDFRNRLRQVQKDVADHTKKVPVTVDQSSQTSTGTAHAPCSCKESRNGTRALNGEENLLLRELFFSGGNSHGMPPEVEDLFFPPDVDRNTHDESILDVFQRS